MTTVNAYSANETGGKLKPFKYELPEFGSEQVDIKVHYCGLCSSDLSMLYNDWGMTQYPFVQGHDAVGEVVAVGKEVKSLRTGDLAGVEWNSASCMHCDQCMGGSHHLCNSLGQTIVGCHGGFSDYVRSRWSWAIPLPHGIDMKKAGLLLCGGITVFNPTVSGVKPTYQVGAVLEPLSITGSALIAGEKSVAGSPNGSPALTCIIPDFCVRHNIYPMVEEFPMPEVNEAFVHLKAGKARNRIVLKVYQSICFYTPNYKPDYRFRYN